MPQLKNVWQIDQLNTTTIRPIQGLLSNENERAPGTLHPNKRSGKSKRGDIHTPPPFIGNMSPIK